MEPPPSRLSENAGSTAEVCPLCQDIFRLHELAAAVSWEGTETTGANDVVNNTESKRGMNILEMLLMGFCAPRRSGGGNTRHVRANVAGCRR